MSAQKILIYTDGSCIGNPGPGGWAAVIFEKNENIPTAKISGGEPKTTNNRMEMLAMIEALKYLEKKSLQASEINLFSDSNLIIQTVNQGWKRKANLDLWEELDQLNEEMSVTYNWVKGHAKDKWNNECDKLAQQAARKYC